MKRQKRKNTEIELGGQDSFLDLVSNIIGILIILVMVAGIRAQYSSAYVIGSPEALAPPQMLAELEEKYQAWQEKARSATQLRIDVEELELQSEIVAEQIYLQSGEYAALFEIMVSARADIQLAAEAKSQTFKEKIELQRQLMEANARLEQIDQAKTYLQQVRPQATVLENTPTPLSQTVENKEIHVRLLGGRVVYVPITELAILFRGHLGEEQRRYSQQRATLGKVGPIDNFELEFLVAVQEIPMQGSHISLRYGEVVPVFEPLGQPLRQALASPQSEFRRKLETFHRSLYTVTVWVYSDSFEEYQELKQFLQEQGYTVAARPMPNGSPIGISPHGTRSSTQ